MDTPPPWMEIAEKELGTAEVQGPGDNPRIIEYNQATHLRSTNDEVPWCASFVGWCLQKAGIRPTFSAAARSYQNWGDALKDPKFGCIVVLQRGTNPALGHVGFYVGSTTPDTIRLLAGNQGDKVSIENFPKTRVISYRWPKK